MKDENADVFDEAHESFFSKKKITADAGALDSPATDQDTSYSGEGRYLTDAE